MRVYVSYRSLGHTIKEKVNGPRINQTLHVAVRLCVYII